MDTHRQGLTPASSADRQTDRQTHTQTCTTTQPASGTVVPPEARYFYTVTQHQVSCQSGWGRAVDIPLDLSKCSPGTADKLPSAAIEVLSLTQS